MATRKEPADDLLEEGEPEEAAAALKDPNSPIPIRFSPEQKEALRKAAKLDYRPVSSFIRVAVLKTLREMGLWDPLSQDGPDSPRQKKLA